MKTHTFIFWISLLVLFPHGQFSKSITDKEQNGIDSESTNDNSEAEIENGDVALHESFRPRHKYKANSRQARFSRSDNENDKDQEAKAPQCAVMYKDNEPVGILQPYKESYRFLPVNGDSTLVDINPVPVKRKSIMEVLYPNKINEDYNEESSESRNQFADDRYPSIFAKFKIDSRLDKTLNPDLNMKRSMYKRDSDKPGISDEQVNSLKTTLSKMKSDNSALVEEKLKNILDDMGLIDDYDDKEEAKREVAEDENMEQGTNKIDLIKEEHNDTRNKRGDFNDTTEGSTETTQTTAATTMAAPTKVEFDDEHTEEVDSIDLFKAEDAKEESGKEDPEIESEETRQKRQFEETDAKDASGNNSNLVKEGELNQYEKRVEREIRDKIKKLKEEVKEEIKNLKRDPKVNEDDGDNRRKKRQAVNTLVDEETRDIDPNLNDEQPQREHHVRRKRSLDLYNFVAPNESTVNSRALEAKQRIIDNIVDLPMIITFGETDLKVKEAVKKELGKENPFFSSVDNLETDVLKPNVSNMFDNLYRKRRFQNNDNISDKGSTNTRRVYCPNKYENIKERFKNKIQRLPITEAERKTNILRSALNETNIIKGKRSCIEAKKKRNIIHILNVIGKKKHNSDVNYFDNKRNDDTNSKFGIKYMKPSLIEGTKINNLSRIVFLKKPSKTTRLAPLTLTQNATGKRSESLDLNKSKNLETNDCGERKKRFIGINPILENKTSNFHSRSLKQFDGKSTEVDLDVTNKRTSGKIVSLSSENVSNASMVHVRRKRQSEDLERNADEYEYDPGFNEDPKAENQEYEEQPYSNNNIAEENNAYSSKASSNCNCDKTGGNCKCGTQKSDLSVPSLKEDNSEYIETPGSVIEKKSISHCNCDKNGKHCKCRNFRENYQYSDNDEQSVKDDRSADNEDDYNVDELETGAGKNARREPRAGIRLEEEPGEDSNAREVAEDYSEDYDIRNSARLSKREAKSSKSTGGQRFQNGEYFVDLHPNIYRLTPVETSREKRDNFKDLVGIHGGGPVVSHLVAIRQRSMLPHSRFRRRVMNNDDNREPRQLIDMSDEDIFGALPQGFAGELARYKRVKRSRTNK